MDINFLINDDNETNQNIIVNNENNMNILTDDNDDEHLDRFLVIIKSLGLNVNITYPLNLIVNIIIELHTSKEKSSSKIYNNYTRMYRFKKDNFSTKIKEILDLYQELFAIVSLRRKIRLLYLNYRYNLRVSNKTSVQTNTIIGFNNKHPCWNSLENLII